MTLWDKLVMVFLLATATGVMIFQGFFMSSEAGERVVITLDNQEYATFNFSDIKDRKAIEIKTEYGSNTVVIEKDGVYVSEADCPDKLDVKAGKISKASQVIVCIPNRLMIEIKGGERKVDKVTY